MIPFSQEYLGALVTAAPSIQHQMLRRQIQEYLKYVPIFVQTLQNQDLRNGHILFEEKEV